MKSSALRSVASSLVRLPLLLLLAILLLIPSLCLAEVSGVLTDRTGAPLSGVTVLLEETGEAVETAADGSFRFPAAPGTYTLVIFDERRSVTFEEGVLLPVRLESFSESIIVRAPALEALSFEGEDLDPAQGGTLTEILAKKPELHQVGLGGALATLGIGGFGKHRVLTTLSGYRVSGDRRAGSDLGMVIPALIEQADVYRSGTGTSHGSQAIGGVIDLRLPEARGDQRTVSGQTLYGTNGQRLLAQATVESGGFLVAAAYDEADSYETGKGVEQPGFYSRANLALSKRMEGDERLTMFDLFVGRGWDIGKPYLSDDPAVYPEQLVAIAGVRSWGEHWDYLLGVIPQKLETKTADESSQIDSLNLQGSCIYHREGVRLGLETYTRQGVDARVQLPEGENRPLDGAAQWEVSPVVSGEIPLGSGLELSLGARSPLFSASSGSDSRREFLFTGHAALSLRSAAGLFSAGLLRTGRFPTLEELFYSGMTARGYVEGNPDLEPERGFGGRVSWERAFPGLTAHASYHIQELRDYVERVNLGEGHYAFQNVQNARVQDASAGVSRDWFYLGAAWAEGHDSDSGERVDDIPPLKLTADCRPRFGDWQPRLSVVFAGAQERIGPSEKEVPRYAVVDLGLAWSPTSLLTLEATAANLFDEEYFPAADEKAVPAPGRSLIFSVRLAGGF